MSTTINRIIEIVSLLSDIPENHIKPNYHLINDLGLDSLNILEVIMSVEDNFDIYLDKYDDEMIYNGCTINEIAAIVDEYLNGR